ncbi:DNA/RNA non-specific endonuclease [Leptonema illini]|uniref:DNA/RNA non-specific endonuclease n=1 Tax=Leptonema illini TaxID=183 RepID=UPI000990CB06
MEKEWQTALDRGSEVTVDIKPTYPGNSLRPDSIEILYAIDNKRYWRSFENVSALQ